MDDKESTLLIRHLPGTLKLTEREDLLKFFGAKAVRCMTDVGPLKYCAFASFDSPQASRHALTELHQLEVQGSRLVAELSQGTFLDPTPLKADEKIKPEIVEEVPKLIEPVAPVGLEDLAPNLKVNYPINPRLLYNYPPPTVEILTNIANTLASVPRFYVQVLHLMNKMNLPPPFGLMTQTPPLKSTIDQDEPIQELEMEVSSSDEGSEIESVTDTNVKTLPDLPVKRPLRTKQPILKRVKLQKIISAPKSGKTLRRDEVFERATKEPPRNKSTTGKSHTGEPSDVEVGDVKKFVTLRELERNRLSSRRIRKSRLYRDYKRGKRTSTLFVENLHKDIPEAMITFIYGRYINWENETESKAYNVKLDRENRCCSVSFPSEDIAELALEETNGYHLMGEYMVVRFLPVQEKAEASEEKRENNTNIDVVSERGLKSKDEVEHRVPELKKTVSSEPSINPIAAAFSQTADAETPIDDEELRAATPEFIEREDTPERNVHTPTIDNTISTSGDDDNNSEVVPQVDDDPRYISLDQIKSGQIPQAEMSKLKIFKNYNPGDSTNRLYVKNLNHKKIEEEDLLWIFGRFLNDKSSEAKDVLEIKLMKEGRMKGQAFVTFPNINEAQSALKSVNGFMLHEKYMVIQFGRTTS